MKKENIGSPDLGLSEVLSQLALNVRIDEPEMVETLTSDESALDESENLSEQSVDSVHEHSEIRVDEDQTEDENNPYRSGNQWVIKEEIADKVFPDVSKELGYAFIGIKVAQAIGLPVKKFDNNNENTNI